MDRRNFLTRASALIAISVLPLPQAEAAIQPKMASGVIQDMEFYMDKPIKLIVDGPLKFINCKFTFDNSKIQNSSKWHGVKFTSILDNDDQMLLIANPHKHQVILNRCNFDMSYMKTDGFTAVLYTDQNTKAEKSWFYKVF